MEGSILRLDDACLELILSCTDRLSHLDLLRCARVCRRLCRLICTAEQAWAACYQQQYGTPPVPSAAVTSYRQIFKDRCISEAKERRLKLKLQRYQLQSDQAALQRELRHMKSKLAGEQQQQQQLIRQLKQLQHAKAAKASGTQWHLSSVQLYHNKVVQAAPVALEAELASLQQQQRVSQLEQKTLQAGIRSREGRLEATTRQLAALQG